MEPDYQTNTGNSFGTGSGTSFVPFEPAAAVTYRVYDGPSLTDGTAVLRGIVTMPDASTTRYADYLPVLSAYCGSGTLWMVAADDTTPDGCGNAGLWGSQATCINWSSTPFQPNNPAPSVPPFASGSVTVGSVVTQSGGLPTISHTPHGSTTTTTYTCGQPIWSNPAAADIFYGPQSYCLFPLPTIAGNASGIVNPGDAVTFSFADGVFNCGGGPANNVPAVSGQPVTNGSGVRTLPQNPPPVRTMGVGFNAWTGSYYADHPLYANLVKIGNNWVGIRRNPSLLVFDADGYPTAASFAASGCTSLHMMIQVSDLRRLGPAGLPARPGGQLDAALRLARRVGEALLLPAGRPTTGLVSGTGVATAATNNAMVATFANDPNNGGSSPSVMIYYAGGTVANIRVYDPTITNPLTVGKWHPLLLERMAG